MLINLSTTRILMDMLRGEPAGRTPSEEPAPAAEAVPFLGRLLPLALREGLVRRAGRRALAAAIARLDETSPHLLDDIGVPGGRGARARTPAARILPMPEPRPAEPWPGTPSGLKIAAE